MSDQSATELGVRFLSDEPADADSFETHSVLAEAIARAIRSNQHLKVIGLLGRWGSGKSTVIRFLEQRLCPSGVESDVLFFTYDAWLNQSDPQRRAFLERLVAYLIKHNVIDNHTWTAELRKLSRPSEESTTRETSIFSNDAKIFALALSPLALSLPLWGLDTLGAVAGANPTNESRWALNILGLSILLPFLVWLGILLKRAINKQPLTILPPLLSDQYPKETFVRTERNPEPTSLEFGRTFRRLMRAVLRAKKRLVIVIDNIDRVDEKDAINIWANVRSFFLASHEGTSRDLPFPTVMLPFDDKAISDIFSEEATSDEGDKRRREITESFLDKTFDATFFVAEPVSSDWRDFLDGKLDIAFSKSLKTEDAFWVKKFLAEKFRKERRQVTPRAINKIINSISALYLQWNERGISFRSMAYFAINKDEIERDIASFVLQSSPMLRFAIGDWQREIAALYYGVAKEKAAQILIEDPLVSSISELDAAAFERLRGVPGFGDIMESVTRDLALEAASAKAFNDVVNAAELLSSIEDPLDASLIQSWTNLRYACLATISAAEINGEFARRMAPFFQHLDGENVAGFCTGIRSFFKGMFESTSTNSLQIQILDGVAGSANDELAQRAHPSEPLRAQTDPRTFLLHWLATDRTSGLLRCNASPAELERALIEIGSEEFGMVTLPAIVRKVLSEEADLVLLEGRPNWNGIIAKLEEAVDSSTEALSISGALDALIMLALKEHDAQQALSRLVESGGISSRFLEFSESNNLDSMAATAAVLVWRAANVPAPAGTLWFQFLKANPHFAANVLENLVKLTDNITIYSLADCYDASPDARGLIEGIVGLQIDKGSLGRINTKKITDRYHYYSRMAPFGKSYKFSTLLSSHNTFWDSLEVADWGEDLARLAKSLLSQMGKDAERALQVLRVRIEKATEQDWKESLASRAGPYTVAFDLLTDSAPELGSQSALRSVLSSNISSMVSSASRAPIAAWFKHLGLMGTRQRRKLIRELLDEICVRSSLSRLFDIVRIGGAEFAEEMKRYSPSDEVVQKIVRPLMKQAKGRTWLRDHRGAVKVVVAAASKPARQAVSKALGQLEADGASDRRSFAESARAEWKL